jgi:hypothetical protein
MKHPEELKTKFLELRARGVSYGHIAETIGVSKPTLIQWGKAMAEEIADLQAAERELVREKLLGNFEQWLGRQVHHFNRLDAEFGRREFKYSPTESVFRMMMASRKLLDCYFFEDERPRQRRPPQGQAPSSPAPHTKPTASPTLELAPAHTPSSVTEEQHHGISKGPQNPSEIQPFPNQDEGGSTSAASHNPNPAQNSSASSPPSLETTEIGNHPSETDTGANTIAGRFISALHRLQASEADSSQGESDATSTQSQIPNPKSGIETSAPAYSENPAKTQPFPGQNCEAHNPALSSSPTAEVGRAVLSAPPAVAKSSAESQIENSNSTMAEPSESEADFGGESIPISPFESTRQWLERQGIQVSKIPKGARIITAG